jgi:hypothetical protein
MLGAMRRGLRSLASLAAVSAAAIAASGACSPNTVCKIAGPINDPSNRTLRRDIMSFGLGQFCEQVTARSAPLKLAPDAPVIGRFFPQRCVQRTLENGDLWVQIGGFGYAWTNLSKKVTFTCAATIQYNQDFRCADNDAIYAYFDSRDSSAAPPPDFRVVQIEQPLGSLVQNWIAPFADGFGRQLVSAQLAQGFTVIRDRNGSLDYGVGHWSVGTRPFHPLGARGGRVVYENLRTEVHWGERDFIGPIAVEGDGQAIFLQIHLEGAAALDVFILPKSEGDASLQLYFQYGPAGPLAFYPRFSDVVQYGGEYQRAVRVPAGMYYVVIDNTPSAGQVAVPAPPIGALADAAAVVDYAIQVGDAP